MIYYTIEYFIRCIWNGYLNTYNIHTHISNCSYTHLYSLYVGINIIQSLRPKCRNIDRAYKRNGPLDRKWRLLEYNIILDVWYQNSRWNFMKINWVYSDRRVLRETPILKGSHPRYAFVVGTENDKTVVYNLYNMNDELMNII